MGSGRGYELYSAQRCRANTLTRAPSAMRDCRMRPPTRRWPWSLRTAPGAPSHGPFRPRVERLEDRCVPAAVSEFLISPLPPAPQGIVAGPDGALWYTDPSTNKIGRITTSGGVTEFTVPTRASDPRGITVGP